MQPIEIAALFSELAVAIFGFSGIAVVIGRRFTAQSPKAIRLQALIYSSGVTIAGGILPMLFFLVTAEPWKYSALAMLVINFFFILDVNSRVYKRAGRLFVNWLEGILTFVTVSFWLWMVVMLAYFEQHVTASYLFWVAWSLGLAARNFALLIVSISIEREKRDT